MKKVLKSPTRTQMPPVATAHTHRDMIEMYVGTRTCRDGTQTGYQATAVLNVTQEQWSATRVCTTSRSPLNAELLALRMGLRRAIRILRREPRQYTHVHIHTRSEMFTFDRFLMHLTWTKKYGKLNPMMDETCEVDALVLMLRELVLAQGATFTVDNEYPIGDECEWARLMDLAGTARCALGCTCTLHQARGVPRLRSSFGA